MTNAPDLNNVVELEDVPRPPEPMWRRVPARTVVHLCLVSERSGRRDLDREGLAHPDVDRLRAWVLRITLAGRRLTPRELRWVHRVLIPVMEAGRATSQDAHVRSVQVAGQDLPRRRACFGDRSRTLQVWVERRVAAAWEFEGQPGHPPRWLVIVGECVAQEALRPEDVAGLTPPDYFRNWELRSRVRSAR